MATEILRPDGEGEYSEFTPSTGDNWENVDEETSDGDTTYNVGYNTDSENGRVSIYENSTLSLGPSTSITTSYSTISNIWTSKPSNSEDWTVEDISSLQIGVYSTGGDDDTYTIESTSIPSGSTINSVKVYAVMKLVDIGRGRYNIWVTQVYVEIDYTESAGAVNPKLKQSGTFATATIKTKISGTFTEKPQMVKVGGTFQ